METENNNNNENNSNVKNINKLPPLRGTKEVKSSDALRRAKAKYYQKKKQNDAYMQDMRSRALNWYYQHKGPSPNPINEIELYFPRIVTE